MTIDLLGDVAAHSAARTPDALAIADGKRQLTYAELETRATRLARYFIDSGIQKGDRVAICLRNQVEFVEAHLAALRAGCVSVPLPHTSTKPEMEAYLADCTPSVVVAASDLIGRTYDPRSGIVSLTDTRLSAGDLQTLDDAIGSGVGAALPDVDSSDLSVLMYTTGTSARPKAVMLSHRNTLTAVENEISVVGQAAERELIVLPLSHSYGLGQLYCNLATGGSVFLKDGLTRLKTVLDALTTNRITAFACTPAGFTLILERGEQAFRAAGATLRLSVVNSSPLSRELSGRLAKVLPQMRIFVYYGLTEASRATFLAVSAATPETHESVGRPAPGITVSVMADGVQARTGEIGEIVISGDTVALGYWRRPDETATTFAGSTMRTGDLGCYDEFGNLWIRGRIKDIINVGGLKVSPAEVEECLRTHAAVRDCAVCRVPDQASGEAVAALIVPTGTVSIDPENLHAHCAQALQHFKIPSRWIVVDSIPRADSGKPLRRLIEARAAEGAA